MKKSEVIFNFLRTLKLSSAEWYGQPFEPLPWFKEVIRGIYDNVDSKGIRRVKEAFIEIPRKNAKSMSISGLALYHALPIENGENEKDGQIYIVASDRSNAKVIFKMLVSMVNQSSVLSKLCKIVPSRNEIYIKSTDSIIKAMSSDVENKHGLSPSLVIYDELHTAKNRELYDVMQTGMGARKQPLIIAITTAGNDTNSFCYDQYIYAKNILDGVIKNPAFYAYIKELPRDADWKDPENWRKANPSWGITVKPEYIRSQFVKALNQTSAENNFRRLYLNQWVEQANRWFSMEVWNRQIISSDNLGDIDLTGQECFLGMDLSALEDMTAIVQVFKHNEHLILKPHFFLPMMTVENHPNNVVYKNWVDSGDLIATPGNTIDYDWICDYICKLNEENPINTIGYDPWNATQLLIRLTEKGFNTVEYQQSWRVLNLASKEFERKLKAGEIWHYNHPVLNWCANNVMVQEDKQENIKPIKPSKYAKIDGIAASIMGCDLASRVKDTRSVYEDKELLII